MIWPVTDIGSLPTTMEEHPILGYDRFHSGIDYAAGYTWP